MDTQTITAYAAGLAAVVSIFTLLSSIIQASKQKTLETEINRLSVNLDQSLKRCEHVIKLTHDIYLLSFGFNKQRMLEHSELGLGAAYILELQAITRVIGDSTLVQAVDQLFDALMVSDKQQEMVISGKTTEEAWHETQGALAAATQDVFYRTFELIKLITDGQSIAPQNAKSHTRGIFFWRGK